VDNTKNNHSADDNLVTPPLQGPILEQTFCARSPSLGTNSS